MNSIALAKSVYQPQIDGLRALAIMLVLFHHYDGPFYKEFNFGPIGVRFFFVLSGFLITRILLKSRDKLDRQTSSRWGEFASFQARRLMRTMPVYYLSLAIAAAISIQPVRETLGWTLLFLTNVYMTTLPYFPDAISHFWSLAVQEQFYLFWPMVLFLLPQAWIKQSFVAMIVAAWLFRFYCISSGASDAVRWFSLPGSLDTFAAGGFLAYASIKNPYLIQKRWTRWWSGTLALLSLVLANRLRGLPLDSYFSIWIETLEALAMAWVVACAVRGFNGWCGRFLSWKPLTYVGKISYGIYIFHVLVAILLHPIFLRFGLGGSEVISINVRFFLQTLATLAVASFSWHYFEQPIFAAREKITTWFVSKSILTVARPAPDC